MRINSIFSILMIFSLLFMVGCDEDPIIDKAEDNLFGIGGTALNVKGATGDEFDLNDAELTPISYEVYSLGEDLISVNMYYTLYKVNMDGDLVPGTPQLVENITTTPAVRTLNVEDAASGLGLSVDDLKLGDQIEISFDEVISSEGEYNTGARVVINVIDTNVPFKSALGGLFDAVATATSQGAGINWDDCAGNSWTGTVEWVGEHSDPEGAGVYLINSTADSGEVFEDASHGGFYSCYGTDAQANFPLGDLRLTDTDGVIAIIGTSQWGEVYTIANVVVEGATLTFNWTNDYGEGAEIQLTRQDGEDWPENLSN